MNGNGSFLLDTHVFIWWMKNDKILPEKLKQLIENQNNLIFLSVISIWEMIVKSKLGKLKLPANWSKSFENIRFEIMPLELKHILTLEKLPLHHKDPFDRMLISQAISEKTTLITNDQKIKKYKVKTIF